MDTKTNWYTDKDEWSGKEENIEEIKKMSDEVPVSNHLCVFQMLFKFGPDKCGSMSIRVGPSLLAWEVHLKMWQGISWSNAWLL
jgi:hypothetical protein